MAELLKRIVAAQADNVLIEDLGHSGVFLRRKVDSRDLLGQFVEVKNKFKFTLAEICNSRSLDNLIKRGILKLFNENRTDISVGVARKIRQTDFSALIPDLSPGDILAYSFSRDAQITNANDTLSDGIDIVSFVIFGTFWR